MQGSTSLKNEVKLPSLDTSFRIDITIFFFNLKLSWLYRNENPESLLL